MEGAWHFTHWWASGPATAIRVRVSCKAKLAVRRAASVIKLAGWPAKAVTGRQHQKQGPRETEELAAGAEIVAWHNFLRSSRNGKAAAAAETNFEFDGLEGWIYVHHTH